MPRPNGFTIRELAVVVVMILVLIALVMPALNVTRRGGTQMQNSTQLRGIHSALVISSQENHGYYIGRDKEGKLGPEADVAWRFRTLIQNNYFTTEYAQSTVEAAPAAGYSYDMAGLADITGQRFDGWADTTNPQTVMVSDRLAAGVPGMSSTYLSVNPSFNHSAIAPGDWRGSVGYNDNHVDFETTAILSTNDGKNNHPNDDLFYPESGDDALMIYAGT